MIRPIGRLTFFFSDVEGSTRLLIGLGDGFAGAHAEHQQIVRAAFDVHSGMEVSTEGDSFFAVFVNATNAVAAAADIQRGLASHPWPARGDGSMANGLAPALPIGSGAPARRLSQGQGSGQGDGDGPDGLGVAASNLIEATT